MSTRRRIRVRSQATQPSHDNRFLAPLFEICNDHSHRLSHNASTIDSEPVLCPKRQLRVLELDEFFGGDVDSDLLLVTDPTGWSGVRRTPTLRGGSGGANSTFHGSRH